MRRRPYRLASEPWVGMLERFFEPYRNHTPDWRAYTRGRYGPKPWLPELCWGTECGDARSHAWTSAPWAPLELPPLELPELSDRGWRQDRLLDRAPAPALLAVARARACPHWKAPRPVTLMRVAGERDTVTLTDCDGALLMDALDRLSVLARPPGTIRPELPLPVDPQGSDGEWSPSVRLLHPRLAWMVSEVAESFPGRPIVLVSGYRRDGHSGLHGKGLALDLAVSGVDGATLFAVCRRLRDAGCGYYPNNRFVHIDVRPYATGRVAWVDESGPGEPSRYVDGWPGVLAPGIAWRGGS